MLELLYSVLVSTLNRMPLLITGPPGCGKTLAYNTVCEMLRGPSLTSSIPFQMIRKAKKLTYQCSGLSSGPELAKVFANAHTQQLDDEERYRDKYITIVGVDEAGLVPENRQALKSLHDFLDQREIGVCLMSNTTLDAAKTSRMIQLLQAPPSMEGLVELSWGILVDEDLKQNQGHLYYEWKEKPVKGICEAFYRLNEVIQKDYWFHTRDFVFFCRHLRNQINENQQTLNSLFDSKMLMASLRRHFQTVSPNDFPFLTTHFFSCCQLDEPENDCQDAQVVETLRLSLQDQPKGSVDPTAVWSRYQLIVDPTDSESAVDLLFSKTLKLLDSATTKIIALSDFSEDSTTNSRTAVLAQLKTAIELGETVLLINSAPLQSALYDVINRHYAYSVNDDGSKDAYAMIGRLTSSYPAYPLCN